jgi:mono/diheme cytochrome c family protein
VRIVILSLLLPLVGAGCATEPAAQFSGTDLYLDYCASCHGVNGEGDGQVAGVMQIQVPNLRSLSERNNGTFPEQSVTEYIDGRTVVAAHGDRRMPVWGEVLNWTEDDDTETERIAQQRIAAIVEFLDEIQY